ncbi:hypothetical protein ACF09C_32715 [Streptomyces sp. NPDC014870]|uniref:hypothetical protein n=1 Tax=Streptomyces sp. NPDC014870 TaxID=3364925 RepID=UPI0037020CA7
MAVQEARQCHDHAGCAESGRAGHRRAVAAFLARRDELAAGEGVPAAVAHSPGASRQWVSDALAQSARSVAAGGRGAGEAWLRSVRSATLGVVWGLVVALLLAQALTAIGAGWTGPRTAGLVAALVLAVPLTFAAHAHRARGGVLAPLIGEDNRLSTSRAVAACWLLLAVYVVVFLALRLATGDIDRVGLGVRHGAGLLTVFALTAAVAVGARRIVWGRVAGKRLQKVPADRPRAADLLCDDDGRAALTDVAYVLASGAVLVLAAVRLGRAPDRLPEVPWALVLLVAVAAAGYLAALCTQGGRPVILSVVRSREAGDLDSAIRTGDDIEIRGVGFVPPGASGPDALTRLVVRVGAVHAHVPLVPVPGGFANPTDSVLTVPLPVDVEPGRVEVWVVTASGVETDRVTIDIVD